MHVRFAASLLGMALVAGSVRSAPAQSLADAAKKAEESRKKTPEPAKVYTNKDLKPVPSSAPPPSAGEAEKRADEKPAEEAGTAAKDAKPAGEQAGAAAPADASKKPEYWHKRMTDLQTQLDRDQTYLDAVQSRINALTTEFVNRDDPAQRAVIERERTRNLGELQRLQKAIETDRKAIADFEEEARRAGVPPGWIR
jgi:hypothetical protein